jgi:hypothetical protein
MKLNGCCPSPDEVVYVTRVVLSDVDSRDSSSVLRSRLVGSQKVLNFKALSKRNGNYRTSSIRNTSQKARRLRQALGSAVSLAIPGDTDPFRSPVRSAIYRTLTPGKPSVGRITPGGRDRGYRCPEGYQYGGRFTDSRLSTCGQKLFDIPSILGLAISALRKLRRTAKPTEATGKPITGESVSDSIIQSRRPQIPRVGNANNPEAGRQVVDLIQQIGAYNGRAARMVRRDGFVLEPVVPPKVLRAIPDNRDMEGATYLLSALSPADVGGEELGMLSNTGIRSLVYVMPGGSTLTLEKKRQLTVGERRKLGRTVNSASQIDNSRDPAARLKNVAQETGDGMLYTEKFVGIKNPNEMVDGKERWATQAFKKRRSTAPKMQDVQKPGKGKISSVDEAIAHIASGGSISDVSPSILAQVLADSQKIRLEKISAKQSLATIADRRFILNTNTENFQHLGEYFAADLQRHLGLKAPAVAFADSAKDARNYLRADVESVADGAKLNPSTKFNDLKPRDVAAMMIAEFVTDQRERPGQSIYPIQIGEDVVPVLAQNTTSGLTALDKVQITKRMSMKIASFYEGQAGLRYSEYYNSLKKEQQILFRKYIESLILKARSFRIKALRERLSKGGLSQGEIAHLNIIEKLFNMRVELLSTSKKQLLEVLRG